MSEPADAGGSSSAMRRESAPALLPSVFAAVATSASRSEKTFGYVSR